MGCTNFSEPYFSFRLMDLALKLSRLSGGAVFAPTGGFLTYLDGNVKIQLGIKLN